MDSISPLANLTITFFITALYLLLFLAVRIFFMVRENRKILKENNKKMQDAIESVHKRIKHMEEWVDDKQGNHDFIKSIRKVNNDWVERSQQVLKQRDLSETK